MHCLQGEFVSVGRLEATYAGNSDLINQMYIYGSGLRSYLLAVVVPSEGESAHPCLACLHFHLAAACESPFKWSTPCLCPCAHITPHARTERENLQSRHTAASDLPVGLLNDC